MPFSKERIIEVLFNTQEYISDCKKREIIHPYYENGWNDCILKIAEEFDCDLQLE